MDESTSREKILKKIRNALIEKNDPPFPILDQDSDVFPEITDSLDVTFAQALLAVAGKFVYCESEDEFPGVLKSFILEKDWPLLFCLDPFLQNILRQAGIPFESDPEKITEARIGITRCEALIARFGSVMVSSRLNPGRKIIVTPEIHVVVGFSSQLVPDLKQAYKLIRKRYGTEFPSMVSVITGPSRTADIEKTLVMGAHGPRELYVFLIEDTVNGSD
ncbi:MAG: LUD domain-containing protein [Bacteroidales bacterium]|nr:LUD domain-containing protein [Bacteroidales bacterium]